jgi:Beta-lactamase superfamily domain
MTTFTSWIQNKTNQPKFSSMKRLTLDPSQAKTPTRDADQKGLPQTLPKANETKIHPTGPGGENTSLFFVGTATTILEWEGIRIMTDPNFLHAGDHVHLGPGVTGTRKTNPAVDIHDLPRVDAVLLSHYHADHFDELVEKSLRRDLPIITTPHAKSCLQSKGEDENFKEVYDLDFFQSVMVDIIKNGQTGEQPAIKVTGMPGKHVPPGPLSVANDLLKAVPPTNGWMVELGYTKGDEQDFESGYRLVQEAGSSDINQ